MFERIFGKGVEKKTGQLTQQMMEADRRASRKIIELSDSDKKMITVEIDAEKISDAVGNFVKMGVLMRKLGYIDFSVRGSHGDTHKRLHRCSDELVADMDRLDGRAVVRDDGTGPN